MRRNIAQPVEAGTMDLTDDGFIYDTGVETVAPTARRRKRRVRSLRDLLNQTAGAGRVVVTDVNGNTAWANAQDIAIGEEMLGPVLSSGQAVGRRSFKVVTTSDGRFYGRGPGEYFTMNPRDTRIPLDSENSVQQVITPGPQSVQISGAWAVRTWDEVTPSSTEESTEFDPNAVSEVNVYDAGEIEAGGTPAVIKWAWTAPPEGEEDQHYELGPMEAYANKGRQVFVVDANGYKAYGFMGTIQADGFAKVFSEPYIEVPDDDPNPVALADPPAQQWAEGDAEIDQFNLGDVILVDDYYHEAAPPPYVPTIATYTPGSPGEELGDDVVINGDNEAAAVTIETQNGTTSAQSNEQANGGSYSLKVTLTAGAALSRIGINVGTHNVYNQCKVSIYIPSGQTLNEVGLRSIVSGGVGSIVTVDQLDTWVDVELYALAGAATNRFDCFVDSGVGADNDVYYVDDWSIRDVTSYTHGTRDFDCQSAHEYDSLGAIGMGVVGVDVENLQFPSNDFSSWYEGATPEPIVDLGDSWWRGEDANASGASNYRTNPNINGITPNGTNCFAIDIKKASSDGGYRPGFRISCLGGSTINSDIGFNHYTGYSWMRSDTTGGTTVLVEDRGTYWRVHCLVTDNGTNTYAQFLIYPARHLVDDELVTSNVAVGTVDFRFFSASATAYPIPYIPTVDAPVKMALEGDVYTAISQAYKDLVGVRGVPGLDFTLVTDYKMPSKPPSGESIIGIHGHYVRGQPKLRADGWTSFAQGDAGTAMYVRRAHWDKKVRFAVVNDTTQDTIKCHTYMDNTWLSDTEGFTASGLDAEASLSIGGLTVSSPALGLHIKRFRLYDKVMTLEEIEALP